MQSPKPKRSVSGSAWWKDLPSRSWRKGNLSGLQQRFAKVWVGRSPLFRLRVISVFLLVGFWNLLTASNFVGRHLEGEGPVRETLRELRDTNLHIQLRAYQALNSLQPKAPPRNDIVLAAISNEEHWINREGVTPTDRHFLANIVRNLASAKPTPPVIGLDFDFEAPKGLQDGQDGERRKDENVDLLDAINEAMENGVAVVLGGTYLEDGEKRWRAPEIFRKDQFVCKDGRCPEFGYTSLLADRREVPIEEEMEDESRMPSFAEAIARSHPSTLSRRHSAEKLFGAFGKAETFQHASPVELAANKAEAIASCAGKVVVVGGSWNSLAGYGPQEDVHLSPVGPMLGIELQANYVRSLIWGPQHSEVLHSFDVIIDVVLGLLIYTFFEEHRGLRRIAVLSGMALIPLVLAYILLVSANLYLDFLFPLELYFLHIAYEMLDEQMKEHGHKVATTEKPSVGAGKGLYES